MAQDQRAAQAAVDVLMQDTPPVPPWQDSADDEGRWSESRLEADLLMGTRWPFFRDKSLDHRNGHHDDQGEEQEQSREHERR